MISYSGFFIYFVKWVSRGGGYFEVTWAMVRDIASWSESWGGGGFMNFLDGSSKFFNRSPITLKFGAEKIRERERVKKERARVRAREREQVVVFTFASCCCCSTLVS